MHNPHKREGTPQLTNRSVHLPIVDLTPLVLSRIASACAFLPGCGVPPRRRSCHPRRSQPRTWLPPLGKRPRQKCERNRVSVSQFVVDGRRLVPPFQCLHLWTATPGVDWWAKHHTRPLPYGKSFLGDESVRVGHRRDVARVTRGRRLSHLGPGGLAFSLCSPFPLLPLVGVGLSCL